MPSMKTAIDASEESPIVGVLLRHRDDHVRGNHARDEHRLAGPAHEQTREADQRERDVERRPDGILD